MANARYRFWKKVKALADKQLKKNYLKPNGGCDSCCPNCKVWESQGNVITTEPVDDWDKRTCGVCNHVWAAIFTPAGFIQVAIPESNLNLDQG